MNAFLRMMKDLIIPSATVSPDGPFYDVILLDHSGSMEMSAFVQGESKRLTMHRAITSLVLRKFDVRPEDYLAAIPYHSYATVCFPFLNVRANRAKILRALKAMADLDSGGTALHTGLVDAETLIAGIPMPTACRPRVLAYSAG